MADLTPRTTIFPPETGESFNSPEFGALDVKMFASDATARELVCSESGMFGADLLRFPAGGSVPMHTHVGDHILIVIRGDGTLIRNEARELLHPGVIYFVPGGQPHEIQATSELVLICVGNQRQPLDSADRLELSKPARPSS